MEKGLRYIQPRSYMRDSPQKSIAFNATAQLKDLLRDVSTYINCASEDEKRRLLTSLKDLLQGHRRKHPRKPCSIRVTYFTQDWSFIDSITNISDGGVFIETSETFSVGQQMKLMFWRPDREEPVKAEGQVAWNPPKGVGVEFPTLPSKDLEKMIETL